MNSSRKLLKCSTRLPKFQWSSGPLTFYPHGMFGDQIPMTEARNINELVLAAIAKGVSGDRHASATQFDLPGFRLKLLSNDMKRLVKHVNKHDHLTCEESIIETTHTNGYRNFVCALMYFDRLLVGCHKDLVTSHNVSMLLYVAFLLANKYNDDLPFSNFDYTNELKLDLRHFNRCESLFLTIIDYDLRITNDDYVNFYTILNNYLERK